MHISSSSLHILDICTRKSQHFSISSLYVFDETTGDRRVSFGKLNTTLVRFSPFALETHVVESGMLTKKNLADEESFREDLNSSTNNEHDKLVSVCHVNLNIAALLAWPHLLLRVHCVRLIQTREKGESGKSRLLVMIAK